MSFSPRRVKVSPTVVMYECRLLRSTAKLPAALRYVEARLKKWRGVLRWWLQCCSSPRGELVIQAVVERAAAASRVDNLLQAWRKLVASMLSNAVPAKQLKRGVWFQDTLVDVRVMVEAWEAACAKLSAEAAVDGGAVRCSYLEPALPCTGAPMVSAGGAARSAAGAGAAAGTAASAPASAYPKTASYAASAPSASRDGAPRDGALRAPAGALRAPAGAAAVHKSAALQSAPPQQSVIAQQSATTRHELPPLRIALGS
jgi:hypothetical protein